MVATMLNVEQFRSLVVQPALAVLGARYAAPAAVELLVGTALAESHLRELRQLPDGPALGLYQIEPATHKDLWDNFLAFRPELADVVRRLTEIDSPDCHQHLVTRLDYATVVARLIYWRAPEPMPAAGDVDGLARYWKAHFNTARGAGDPREWAERYRRHAARVTV